MRHTRKPRKDILRFGFGVRKDENDRPNPEQVEACKQWLTMYAKKKRLPPDECLNSYNLKRVVEDAAGKYVTNGAFIQAAVNLGFKYSEIIEKNAYFHIELRLPEDGRKRVKPTGFSKWLFNQDHLPLAQHAMADPNWPRSGGTFFDFWRYLDCRAHDSRADELSEAWEDWKGKAPRPDWIDTDAVYRHECDFIKYGDSYPDADEESTYLYALVEFEKENDLVRVRYVGRTSSPSKRLRQHILSPNSIARVKWVAELLNKDEYPQMAIFYSGAALSMAPLLEKAAIYAFVECETRWDDELGRFVPRDNALLNIAR